MSDTSNPRLPPRERGRPVRLRGSELGEPMPSAGEENDDTQPREQHSRAYRWLLVGIRYVLPVVVTVCGLVFMALGGETDLEGGASLVSAGLAIYFLNWLYRIGVKGDRERDSEEAAREYFARHGRWPS
jgi:hypothetical protein